jgi:hypothetical protein
VIAVTCTGDNWVGYCQQLNGRVFQAEQRGMGPKRRQQEEVGGRDDEQAERGAEEE